jgi:hypothetical protein
MPGNAAEWTIINVHFQHGTRMTNSIEEPCFYARFLQSRLDEDRWVLYQALEFSFGEAEFWELPVA